METKYWILTALIVVLLLVLYKKQENAIKSCNPECGHSQYCDYDGKCKFCSIPCTDNEVCIYGTCIELNH